MPPVVSVLLASIFAWFRSRLSLQMERIALQHQVAVSKQNISRPKLRPTDRLLWAWLSRLWPGWQRAVAFVQPRTVIAWQKKRFRDHWRQRSQNGTPGRPAIAKDVRALLQDMWQSHPTWGAPRIVGALRKRGINVAKSTVETYRPRVRKPPSPLWKACLKHHGQDVVACDVCTVPTVTFRVLCVLVILAHERRRVVHLHVTEHPTAQWTAPQVAEAFPWDEAPRYLLREWDRMYGVSFRQRVRPMGIEEVLIAPKRPWQHPYVERVMGSMRRECLNDMIVLNEQHLKRVLHSYVTYYHHWRTHRSLEMDAPLTRPVQGPELGSVHKVAEGGGMHHHSERRAA